MFTNNLVSRGSYGFAGTGSGEGISTLNAHYEPNYVFLNNAVISANSAVYPAANFFPLNIGAVRFIDYANRNYRLSADSPYKGAGTDGKDLGADYDVIAQQLGGVTAKTPRPPTSVTAD
jgi:hypothetical protein